MNYPDLPGWEKPLGVALQAQQRSCAKLLEQPDQSAWHPFCQAILALQPDDEAGFRQALEAYLTPTELTVTEPAFFTGYYEASLKGSRTPNARYSTPLYRLPPPVVNYRLPRRQLVQALKGHELLWVDSVTEAFFLEIQGSGRVLLDTGETIRIGYASANGYPYFPIGKALGDRGEIPRNEISLQTLRQWLKDNPDQVTALLNLNQSFVFFKELEGEGPLGTQGVPLTPKHSLAVDPQHIQLGTPLWVDIPELSLSQLMVAQDTGGAIKGPTRCDFFWGFGEQAEQAAGPMKDRGRLYALLPIQQLPPAESLLPGRP